jgi:hypothetical protein
LESYYPSSLIVTTKAAIIDSNGGNEEGPSLCEGP